MPVTTDGMDVDVPPASKNNKINDDKTIPPVQLQKNVRVNKKRIPESSNNEDKDDSDQEPKTPIQPKKKARVGSKKNRPRSTTVDKVDNGSKGIHQKDNNKKPTGQSKKSSKSRKKGASNDSGD